MVIFAMQGSNYDDQLMGDMADGSCYGAVKTQHCSLVL
jgi:hypothetical protein